MRLSSSWRLTIDPSADAHAEAARFALAGRREMAIFVLQEAIASNPDDITFQNHLARIKATPQVVQTIELKGPIVAVHLVFAWLIFISVLCVFLLVPYGVLRWLAPSQFASHLLGSFILIVGCAVLSIIASVRAFCALWFIYLRFLPQSYALAADEKLPSVITTWQFGKHYTNARCRFFSTRYGCE
jgi:hypothetical protein